MALTPAIPMKDNSMRSLLPLALLVFAHTASAEDWLYLTYPGDTPLKIGRDYLKRPSDWDAVLKHNKITNDRVLPAKSRIRIPVSLLKVTPAPVEVTHAEGNVRVKPDGGTFRPLVVGDKLTGGETVITGPKSFVAYRLADGSKLTQQDTSKLAFGRLAAYGKTGMVSTELDLQNGRIEAGASKQVGPAGGFTVRTPVAIAGLRGTAFRLNVSDDGKILRNEVMEGAVGVAAESREVLVSKAQGTVAEIGKPPEAPRPLLSAPSLAGLPNRMIDLPLKFAWSGMTHAAGWRAQVASDADFQKVLLDSQVAQPEVTWTDGLPDGNYYLRVRAIDTAGLEGMDTEHSFNLDARPLPPPLLSPGEGKRVYQEAAKLSWAASENAQGYLLQIAPGADFPADKTVERRLEPVLWHTETLTPGDYHWRVASLDAQGQPRGWSPARPMRVQPLPNPPKVDARADNGQASLAWGTVAGAASYDLEIARQADFNTPETKLQSRENKAMTNLKPGKYFWRIRAVEGDGQAGAWSKPSPLVMPPEAPSDVRVKSIYRGSLIIKWQGSAPAFRLEFARDAKFEQPLFNHREEANSTRLATPEPGQYWVRVIALSEEGVRGVPSKPVSFNVRHWQ
jgi:hypothetical protein